MDTILGLSNTTWGLILIAVCLLWLTSIPKNLADEKYSLVAIDIGFAILTAAAATTNFMS